MAATVPPAASWSCPMLALVTACTVAAICPCPCPLHPQPNYLCHEQHRQTDWDKKHARGALAVCMMPAKGARRDGGNRASAAYHPHLRVPRACLHGCRNPFPTLHSLLSHDWQSTQHACVRTCTNTEHVKKPIWKPAMASWNYTLTSCVQNNVSVHIEINVFWIVSKYLNVEYHFRSVSKLLKLIRMFALFPNTLKLNANFYMVSGWFQSWVKVVQEMSTRLTANHCAGKCNGDQCLHKY